MSLPFLDLLSTTDVAYASVVVLLGYVVLGITGFGSALVMVPLLAWRFPISLIVPLVLLIDVPASLLHTGLNLRLVAWREIPPLLPTAAVGAWAAMALAQWSQGHVLLLVLGAYIITVAWRGLNNKSPKDMVQGSAHRSVRGASIAGFAVGLVETSFGTGGPVLMTWLSRRIHDPLVLRATMPLSIVIFAGMAITAAAGAGNLQNPLLWQALIALLLPAAAGIGIGHVLAARMGAARLSRSVYALLLISGSTLMLRALFA